jgi:hypothetical protein
MNQESAQRISNELDAAIRNGDVDGIHRIIRDNPNWPPYNLVGIAAINGDIPLLKYTLEDLGHKANEGRYGYRPVTQSHFVTMACRANDH